MCIVNSTGGTRPKTKYHHNVHTIYSVQLKTTTTTTILSVRFQVNYYIKYSHTHTHTLYVHTHIVGSSETFRTLFVLYTHTHTQTYINSVIIRYIYICMYLLGLSIQSVFGSTDKSNTRPRANVAIITIT